MSSAVFPASVATLRGWVGTWRLGAKAFVGEAFALAVLLIATPLLGSNTPTVDITIRLPGRDVPLVVASRHPTVAVALRQANLVVRDGHLLGAKDNNPLPGHTFPATLILNGQPAERSTVLRDGLLTVEDGQDQVEPTLAKTGLPIAPAPPPRLEHYLWHLGTPGSEDAVVGAVSGQVVSASNIVAPSAPSAVTDTVVALTFDDGPWADTPQFLQVLQAKGVKATFCMVGAQVVKLPDIARSVAAAGMTLCNHTMTHRAHLDTAPPDVVNAEIQGGVGAQVRVLGRAPVLYRPPGGAVSGGVEDVANRYGEQVIGWAVDPKDYTTPGVAAIVQAVLAQVRPGAIVLMHDGGGNRSQTLAALGIIIDNLRAQGYGFVTPDAIPAVPLAAPAA